MNYTVSWHDASKNESYSRNFDNPQTAERHSKDMHSWGYDSNVTDENGTILHSFVSCRTSSVNNRFFFAIYDYETYKNQDLGTPLVHLWDYVYYPSRNNTFDTHRDVAEYLASVTEIGRYDRCKLARIDSERNLIGWIGV